jgi:hypothetical protein
MVKFTDNVETSEPVIAKITGTITGDVTVIDVVPGTTISSPADTAVAAAGTAALPVPPAGTRRMTVQNTTAAGASRMRIREAGGAAGTGMLLASLSSITYGGADGAIDSLEAQNVAGPAGTVAIQFEED